MTSKKKNINIGKKEGRKNLTKKKKNEEKFDLVDEMNLCNHIIVMWVILDYHSFHCLTRYGHYSSLPLIDITRIFGQSLK